MEVNTARGLRDMSGALRSAIAESGEALLSTLRMQVRDFDTGQRGRANPDLILNPMLCTVCSRWR